MCYMYRKEATVTHGSNKNKEKQRNSSIYRRIQSYGLNPETVNSTKC